MEFTYEKYNVSDVKNEGITKISKSKRGFNMYTHSFELDSYVVSRNILNKLSTSESDEWLDFILEE